MSDNRTKIHAGAGGRLATLQPGIIGFLRFTSACNEYTTEHYRNGVKLDGRRVDENIYKNCSNLLKVE